MPTSQEVIAAPSQVVDPELGASLLDLNRVRGLTEDEAVDVVVKGMLR